MSMLSFRAKKPVEPVYLRQMRQKHMETCSELGLQEEVCWDLVSITDEICSNIAEHSDARWLEWEMNIDQVAHVASLVFRDDGCAFNPKAIMLSTDRADPIDYIEAGRHVGLALVGKLAQKIEYRRREGDINELIIHKNLN